MKKFMLNKLKDKKLRLGLGTAAFGQLYGEISFEECKSIVEYALECGIIYIDTSNYYGFGESELCLGEILKNIPRDKYFISTKVGRISDINGKAFDYSSKNIQVSLDNCLKRLKLDYVDILFAHDVEFCVDIQQILNETLPTLNRLKEEGKTKNIGISGYPLWYLKKIIDESSIQIDFVITYCRYTLFDQTLSDYINFFKEKGIIVINASPTGMGLLTNNGPQNWHPASCELKTACLEVNNLFRNNGLNVSSASIKFTINNQNIDYILLGPKNIKELKNSISAANEPISEIEDNLISSALDIFNKIPLQYRIWENIFQNHE